MARENRLKLLEPSRLPPQPTSPAIEPTLPDPASLDSRLNSVQRQQYVQAVGQKYGNQRTQSLIRSLQREPTSTTAKKPTAKEPEKFATYEEWMASFDNLTTFTAFDNDRSAPSPPDTNPDLDFGPMGTNLKVFGGENPASHDPDAPIDERATDPVYQRSDTQKLADKFLDHPTDTWVQANLPDELRRTAYQLPADCADILVILRHVWLFYHGRTEHYGTWTLGVGAGKTDKERQRTIQNVIVGEGSAYSGNVQTLANSYSDDSGSPILSLKKLQKLLHPGDLLVWEHQTVDKGGKARRTGGHSQTIIKVDRSADGETLNSVEMAQGNEPFGKDEAADIRRGQKQKPTAGRDPLRDTPGRRVEQSVFLGERLKEFVPGKWSWDDGQDDKGQQKRTILVAAGPAGSAARAKNKTGVKTLGEPADWLPVVAKASRASFEITFESAMQAARAAVEGGGSLSAQDARQLGQAAGLRLRELDQQKPALAPDAHLARVTGIEATLDALAKGATQAASMKNVAEVFAAIRAGFDAAARRGETQVDGVRRIPVEGLTRGNQKDDLGASAQSAKGWAIVLIPNSISDKLSSAAKPSVEVLLHLHGKNSGYRTAGSGPARDENIDKIETQLRVSGRQMVAVLPQGVSSAAKTSAFGDASFGFDSNEYLDEVFAKLTGLGVWPKTPAVSQVVLSAHSGGGFGLTQGGMLGSEHAPTKAGGKKLGEVALFDAINGPKELKTIEKWLFEQQLPDVLKQLGGIGKAADQIAFLSTDMRFWAFFTGDPAKAKASPKAQNYAGRHLQLQADLEQWFNDHAAGLDAGVLAALKKNYQVISADPAGDKRDADTKHNQILGSGNLQSALGALP